ncbi:hypothetical protein K435DRAFT_792034 [Dendrothele bispora CBS 962.96]|uniref:Uncharacterized protein n=1 Tax=Dendrothele bispora (strain CBS 962.96) TaxID=1314807 RepID=A0A4S8MKM4_DENBC|nr:hypothetical protein K435DRAFT_792034 [Dendrothele bispora CBS 962.96]
MTELDVFAKLKDIKFKGDPNGPASSMFIFTKRSVLIPNTAILDEGRASDYPDPFSVLSRLGPEADMKFNWIPKVLLMDHAKKDTKPMSFHDLHLLGSSTVLQLVVSSELHGYTVGTFELTRTRTRTREKPNPCGGYGYFHGSTKLAYGSRGSWNHATWQFTGTGWLGSGFLYPDPYPPDPYPQPVATRETRAVH